MTIELITPEEHKTLKDIFNNYPKLTFQNNGFEYINKNEFTEEEKNAFETVTSILKKSIIGFRSFNNFRIDSKGNIKLRLQYAWSESFTGVGYIKLDELLNGFETN
jgi:hypothetical protein